MPMTGTEMVTSLDSLFPSCRGRFHVEMELFLNAFVCFCVCRGSADEFRGQMLRGGGGPAGGGVGAACLFPGGGGWW